jgi:predicted transcriptional regulator of viral defense system
LARRQQLVFGLDQLRELGLTARAVQDRTVNGGLHRIHHTVYSLVPRELLTRDGWFMAAVLACGPGALLSHRSAAALHGLVNGWGRIEVTVPGRNRRRHQGVIVHRSTTLAPTDATVVNRIPCTTVARTLFDFSEVALYRQAERAFDQAESLRVFDLRALEDQLRRNPTRAGANTVRSILDAYDIGSTLTRSEIEDLMFMASRDIGLPTPLVNEWLDLGDGGPMIQPDFMWPEQRLIIEVDGYKWHGTRRRFEEDRRRDQRALVAGWIVVRTTERQLKYELAQLQRTIERLLARGKLRA